jgi:hypothetical protein
MNSTAACSNAIKHALLSLAVFCCLTPTLSSTDTRGNSSAELPMQSDMIFAISDACLTGLGAAVLHAHTTPATCLEFCCCSPEQTIQRQKATDSHSLLFTVSLARIK